MTWREALGGGDWGPMRDRPGVQRTEPRLIYWRDADGHQIASGWCTIAEDTICGRCKSVVTTQCLMGHPRAVVGPIGASHPQLAQWT